MTDQKFTNGSTLSYPRKLTRGSQSIMAANALAQVQLERAGYTDAAGKTLLKQTFPRTVKNAAGNVLVASCAESFLQYLNDGYSDVSSLA